MCGASIEGENLPPGIQRVKQTVAVKSKIIDVTGNQWLSICAIPIHSEVHIRHSQEKN
jgi:hypothetical protein